MYRCLIVLFLMFPNWNASASNGSNEDSSPLDNPVVAITLLELGLALNAKIVADDPNDNGKLIALVGIPWSIALTQAEESEAAKWIVPLFAAAYAAYYIDLDEDEKSETEIFQENLIGMNVVIATALATGYLLGNDENKGNVPGNIVKKEKQAFMGFYPLNDGALFRLMYQF